MYVDSGGRLHFDNAIQSDSAGFIGSGSGLTSITAGQVGAQPTNVNLTTLASNNGGSLSNLNYLKITNAPTAIALATNLISGALLTNTTIYGSSGGTNWFQYSASGQLNTNSGSKIGRVISLATGKETFTGTNGSIDYVTYANTNNTVTFTGNASGLTNLQAANIIGLQTQWPAASITNAPWLDASSNLNSANLTGIIPMGRFTSTGTNLQGAVLILNTNDPSGRSYTNAPKLNLVNSTNLPYAAITGTPSLNYVASTNGYSTNQTIVNPTISGTLTNNTTGNASTATTTTNLATAPTVTLNLSGLTGNGTADTKANLTLNLTNSTTLPTGLVTNFSGTSIDISNTTTFETATITPNSIRFSGTSNAPISLAAPATTYTGGTLLIANDISGQYRVGLKSTGVGTSLATYGSGGNGNKDLLYSDSVEANYGVFGTNAINGSTFNLTTATYPLYASGETVLRLSVTNIFATFSSNKLAPSSISFPASTVPWTNTFGKNIFVLVDNTAITGTAILINGTQVSSSLTGGVNTIPLQPGEYFSETYTIGSPTATWKPY